jgi:predicted transport protein
VTLFLKLASGDVREEPGFVRDVTNIGHFGTGDIEVALRFPEDLEKAKPLIQKAWEKLGG